MYCAGSKDRTGAWDRSQSWAYVSRGQPSSSTFAHVFVVAAAAVSSIPSLYASSSQVQQLASRGLLGSVSIENFDCVSCQLERQPAFPFNTSESMSINIFDLIHSNV